MSRVYPYRCNQNREHYFERVYPFAQYPPTHECVYEGCEGEAHRIITPIMFAVDNVDKVDMAFSLGRNFSNKRELNEHMQTNGMRHLEDSEWAADRAWHDQVGELKRELASKGIDYGQYMAEQQAQQQAVAQERLRAMGLDVKQVDGAEYDKLAGEGTWEDTCEDKYTDTSQPIHNKKGELVGYRGKEPTKTERTALKKKYEDVVVKKNYESYLHV